MLVFSHQSTVEKCGWHPVEMNVPVYSNSVLPSLFLFGYLLFLRFPATQETELMLDGLASYFTE